MIQGICMQNELETRENVSVRNLDPCYMQPIECERCFPCLIPAQESNKEKRLAIKFIKCILHINHHNCNIAICFLLFRLIYAPCKWLPNWKVWKFNRFVSRVVQMHFPTIKHTLLVNTPKWNLNLDLFKTLNWVALVGNNVQSKAESVTV